MLPYGVVRTQWVQKHRNIFTFSIMSQHFDGTGCWNPSLWKTRTCLSYRINTMAANVLATQGARASTVMVLTLFFQNIPVSAPPGLTLITSPLYLEILIHCVLNFIIKKHRYTFVTLNVKNFNIIQLCVSGTFPLKLLISERHRT